MNRFPTQRDVDDYDDEPEPDSETWSLMQTPQGLGLEPVDPVELAEASVFNFDELAYAEAA